MPWLIAPGHLRLFPTGISLIYQRRQGAPGDLDPLSPVPPTKKKKEEKRNEEEMAAGVSTRGEVPSGCAGWFSFVLLFAKLSQVSQVVRCQLKTAVCRVRVAQSRAFKHLLRKEQAFPPLLVFFFFPPITAAAEYKRHE